MNIVVTRDLLAGSRYRIIEAADSIIRHHYDGTGEVWNIRCDDCLMCYPLSQHDHNVLDTCPVCHAIPPDIGISTCGCGTLMFVCGGHKRHVISTISLPPIIAIDNDEVDVI